MVRTPWGACSPKIFFWRWVRLLRRYRLPKWAKMAQMTIFTNKRNFFPRDDLKHSKNQSGPKWPHLSIFSLKFPCNWRSGSPGCGYVSSKFVGGPEMCFYCKIRNFYIFLVHFLKIHQKNVSKPIPGRQNPKINVFDHFLFVFPVLSPRSEPKVLLRPGISLPTFFWWILKKNGP